MNRRKNQDFTVFGYKNIGKLSIATDWGKHLIFGRLPTYGMEAFLYHS